MRKILTIFFVLVTLLLFADQTQIINYNDLWGDHGFSLEQQSLDGVRLNYSIERFIFGEKNIDENLLQTVSLPGEFLPNDEGMPDLPGGGRFIAIPQDSKVELQILNYQVESFKNINLAPAPRIPLDTDSSPLEYNYNSDVYSNNEFYPAEFVKLSKPTQIRGIDVIMVGITPFQYNPVTKELLVYRNIQVKVNFSSGNGQYGVESLRNRWWDPILNDVILNHESLPEIDYTLRNRNREGADYLIISPDDPIFLTWADSIKTFRQQQGISTIIMTTNEVGGNTATAIEAYINEIMDPSTGWDPVPAAILLLGDYGTTGNTVVSPIWNSYCASDNIYADVSGNSMPDVILARMTAQDEIHLETMITKFLNYERNPPTNPDFYDHPITALGWQTERWFQICSEAVGGYFLHEQGKNPVRINAVYIGNPNVDPWSTATNTSVVVNKFGPSDLGYIPATPAELGGWTGGNATMVNNAINDGAFLLQHRDHGGTTGWGEPSYNSTSINGLTNTDLTFVFSINCLTGKYNMTGECFAEKFHRYQYNGVNSGALGIIAASEVSYSFVNDTFVWGMFDNMWPDFLPTYGTTPDSRDVLPAFGNAAGKYFLQQSAWPYNTNNKEVTYNLFHHHGDAFTTVYSEVPQNLTVIHDPVLLGGVNAFTVMADQGSLVALTVDNEIIGTAEGTGTPVAIDIEPQIPGADILITVTGQNYYRYSCVVPVIPPSGPYVVFDAITFDDSAGNNNGLIDFSESILLSIEVENIGTENAENVEIVLSTEDEFIILTDDTENYGTVIAGSTVSVNNGFGLDVDDLVPDEYDVIIELNATNGTDTWISYFSLNLNAPVLEIGEMQIDDSIGNDNGVLDPGENVLIKIPVSNNGHAESVDAIASLTCATAGITIEDETVNLGIIGIESSEDAIYNVTADTSIPFGTPIILSFNVTAGEYEEVEDFPTQVGIHRENFENGFNQYAWEFQGYEISWPNVDPIEDFTIVAPINDVNWSIDTDEYYNGTASAKSFPITHDQASFMSLTLDVTQAGEISFWYKVACEYSPSQTYFYDGLFFIIDGETKDRFQTEGDGSYPWSFASYVVEAGPHTFDWVFVKDGSDGSTMIPDDCAWVDYITFPSIVPVTLGLIAGSVSLFPVANYEEVEISIGAVSVNPDATGLFEIEIPVGIYDITATLAGYETITFEEVEVLEGVPTPVYFEMYYLQAPENLEAVLDVDVVNLAWEHIQFTESIEQKEHSTREFQDFNIYRSIDGGNFELLTTTNDTFYEDVLENAGEYSYYITAMYEQNNESEASNTETVFWDGSGIDDLLIPSRNALYQNLPNPFNPDTIINFDLKTDGNISLKIFNIKGQKIRHLIRSEIPAGKHSVVWNGKDDNGKTVSSGIYFYKFNTGNYQSTKKMLLLK